MNYRALGAAAAIIARGNPASEIVRMFGDNGYSAQSALDYIKWAKSLSRKAVIALGAGHASPLQASLLRIPQRASYAGQMYTTGGTVAAGYTAVNRYDLSSRVWAAVTETQEQILDIVNGGNAMGRDKKTIAKDLEEFCKPNGGARVKGRWGRLAPDKKLEKETNKIAAAQGIDTWNVEGMKRARAEAMKKLKAEGWQMAPEAREYYSRLGSAGVDYRTLRVARTEATNARLEAEKEGARKYGWPFMQWQYDGENGNVPCACHGDGHGGTDKDGSNYSKGMIRGSQIGSTEGFFLIDDFPPTPHPLCGCAGRPYQLYEGDPAPGWPPEIQALKKN